MSSIVSDENIMEERFVAFLDILGFREIVKSIEAAGDTEDPKLGFIKSVLNFMDEETHSPNYASDLPIYIETKDGWIERELGDPRLTYISDCIIISAEPTLDGFKGLSRKIHKLTADLAHDGVFCRGAITKGKLFHKGRVLFGSSYIRAYELEAKAAKFPRVIIDPEILSFFDLSDGKVPLAPAFYGLDADGYYYQRYWTWFLFPPYAGAWQTYLGVVRHRIVANLDEHKNNDRVYEKYEWLRKEFNALISSWSKFDELGVELI